jgi:putative ABC transport system ATP-binding protein
MSRPLVKLQEISKVYEMGEVSIRALRGVDLEIQPGEMISIKGQSGSGKSTLMNLLGCLDQPTSGHYFLEDRDTSSLTSNQLARIRNELIGFVFQGFNLLARTSALENVELPLLYSVHSRKQSRKLAIEALESLGLGDRIHHLPSQLSGGQQQRVAISRALVNKPKLILADEPTGNLDTLTSLEVMSIFQQLNRQGITLVLITHEEDIARYGNRIVVLQDGRVVRDYTNSPRDARQDLSTRIAETVVKEEVTP